MKHLLFSILFFAAHSSITAQTAATLALNTLSQDLIISKKDSQTYAIPLKKGGEYDFNILQKGVDVLVKLIAPNGKDLIEMDSPNGSNGYEKFHYTPTISGNYTLKIKYVEGNWNSPTGAYTVFIKKYTRTELKRLERIKKELIPENKKMVQTLDIDHFWEAYDFLKQCKTYQDSIKAFQELYIDRATDGFIDFIKAREFTAEEYVQKLRKEADFYTKVRQNTFEVKKAEPLIQEVFDNFKKLYPKFQPFKVCFAIGTMRTGGTVSDKFVLIGTELVTSGKKEDIPIRVKNIVAHECVHTQQQNIAANNTNCPLLYAAIREGSCDFIAELNTGSHKNLMSYDYGMAHEKELWETFQAELCTDHINNWLYNGGTVKDKSADLGYFIGYLITKAYYENATNKQQAVIDIIENENPKLFLEKSQYPEKWVTTYHKIPIIKATSKLVNLKEGKSFYKDAWEISPEVKPDIIVLNPFIGKKIVSFLTDCDSLTLTVEPNKHYDFIVLLGKDSAYTRISTFSNEEASLKPKISYTNTKQTTNSQTDTLHFKIKEDNRIYLKGKVNDSDTLNFIYDTGAEGNAITLSLLDKKVKLKLDGSSINVGTDGSSTVQTSSKNKFTIGDLEWTDMKLSAIDYKGFLFDIVLGWEAFESKIIEIDYENERIILHNRMPNLSPEYSKIGIELRDGIHYIPAKLVVEGKETNVWFDFDTGSSGILAIGRDFLNKNHLNTMNIIGTKTGKGSAGIEFKQDVLLVPKLKIGDFEMYQLPVAVPIKDPEGAGVTEIIGNNLLKRFNTFIDFQQRYVYLKPNNLFYSPIPIYKQ